MTAAVVAGPLSDEAYVWVAVGSSVDVLVAPPPLLLVETVASVPAV